MPTTPLPCASRRRLMMRWPAAGLWLGGLVASLGLAGSAQAHDYRVGTLVVDHPYALAGGQAVYIKALRNTGRQPDRLLRASSPSAQAVTVLHQGRPSPLVLAAGTSLAMRHDGPWQLALTGLRAPLQADDEVELTLQFERAGTVQLSAVAVVPKRAR